MKGELVNKIQSKLKKQAPTNAISIPYDDKQRLNDLFADFVKVIDASPNTIRTYKISLKQWFNYLAAKNIRHPTMDTVIAYREELRKQGKKDTTVRNYVMAVKEFFKWTAARHLYPDISREVKAGKVSRGFKKDYLTSLQAKKVLASVDRSTLVGKRNFAMLSVMLTMGLRTIEVSRANVEDIKPMDSATVLYVQGKGHIAKDDSVLMPPYVEKIVNKYLTARNPKSLDEPLFTSTSNRNKNGRMTTRSIRGIIKKIFRAAGFNSPRLTAHSTRHTAATLSLMHGATLEETQHLLRHKNIQTTEIYAHNVNSAKNPAANDVAKALFN